MGSVAGILTGQGLKLGNTQDENGRPAYYITDEEGVMYCVPLHELEELHKRGKLTIEGIREHDAEIRKKMR